MMLHIPTTVLLCVKLRTMKQRKMEYSFAFNLHCTKSITRLYHQDLCHILKDKDKHYSDPSLFLISTFE